MGLALLFLLGLSSMTGFSPVMDCSRPLPEEITFEDLQNEIALCHLQKVDDLVALLPASHLSNYVLLHHSDSIQGATPIAPRVILFGKDAKLLLAFNGNPQEQGYNHLEVIQFRDSNSTFELRDIEFPSTPNGTVQFSGPNPQACIGCHRADPRPNWATYPLWPGAFGGEDDSVFRTEPPLDRSSADWKSYAKFLDSVKDTGRYRFLSRVPEPELPNTTLASAAYALNMTRIARKTAQMTVLSSYRYALLGASYCFYSDHYGAIENYVPAKQKAAFKKTFADIYNETSQSNRAGFLSRITALRKIYPQAPESARVQELLGDYQDPSDFNTVSDSIVAALRWLVENNGNSTADWSMQFSPLTFDFENGYLGIADLHGPLAKALLTLPADSQLQAELEQPHADRLEETCKALQEKSLAELGN
jgi:hypothetical protein